MDEPAVTQADAVDDTDRLPQIPVEGAEEPQEHVMVELESRPVDEKVDLAPPPRRRAAALTAADDDDDDPNSRRKAIVTSHHIEVDMQMLRELQQKKRDKDREDAEKEEELAQIMAGAAIKAHSNAQAVFVFVKSLSALVEQYLPRDENGEIIQSYANFAIEHFLLSIGAISRSSLIAGGRSVIQYVDDMQKSRPIQTWGDFVQRVIQLMKRHPLPPPASRQYSTIRKIVRLKDGKTYVDTIDLMMTDAFWLATREHISNWMGASERGDIDLSLLPELLERLRGVPLPRVAAAMRAVSRDMASLSGTPIHDLSQSSTTSFLSFQDSEGAPFAQTNPTHQASSITVSATEVGGPRPFSPLERFAPSRRMKTPPPLMAPLLHSSEQRLPHVQAVAVLQCEASHYACGYSPIIADRKICRPNDEAVGKKSIVARYSTTPGFEKKSTRLEREAAAHAIGVHSFPLEPSPEVQRPHTLFDPVSVQHMRNGNSNKRRAVGTIAPRKSAEGSQVGGGLSLDGLAMSSRISGPCLSDCPNPGASDHTLRSRLMASPGRGADPDEAANASLRHASLCRLAKTRHRRPVRMVALEGLVGMNEAVEGEVLEQHWLRLLSMRFKLSVLRGSGMPLDQRNLWKNLWDACFDAIEKIGLRLRNDILGITSDEPENIAAHEFDNELRQLVGEVISSALKEHLQLDKQLTDFSKRALSSFDAIVTASTVCSPSPTGHQRPPSGTHDLSDKSFARPIERKDRGSSFLDEQFVRGGVTAINELVDRKLSASKRQSRPASSSQDGASPHDLHRSLAGTPTKSPLYGHAPNGFALGMRLGSVRPAHTATSPQDSSLGRPSDPEPRANNTSLRIASATMSLR